MNQSSQVKNIFDIAQRAMNAQMARMNTIASNLANANTVAGSEEETRSGAPHQRGRKLRPVQRPYTELADDIRVQA